ncbi:hypothetical protein IJJ18_02205 [Candidatus Saccharibacteria bacterium]|nr:hypothetical protein [Candidatus Saccharibacteria bacterium]
MEMTGMNLASMLGIMLASTIAFILIATPLSKRTVGRDLYPATQIAWLIGALVIQFVIVKWAFHPLSYIIFIGVICFMEWLTIRIPERRKAEEIEPPLMRFLAWFFFSLGPIVSMAIAAVAQKGAWAFEGKTIILYCLAPVAVLGIGLIRVAICGDVSEAEDEDDEEETVDELDIEEIDEADLEDSEEIDLKIDGAESVA